ncbi:MAG: hypothetical protein WBA73_03955, partial [Devosia sp.]
MSLLPKLISALWVPSKPAARGPDRPTSPLVIFIHGFTGTPKSTWGKWYPKIGAETDLANFRVDSYAYQTAVFAIPTGIRI